MSDSGGGGGGGSYNTWPSCLGTVYNAWLADTAALVNTAEGSDTNPYLEETSPGSGVYEVITPYDPTTDIAVIATKAAAYDSQVTGIVADTDWETFVDAGITKASSIFSSDDNDIISDLVAQFEVRQDLALASAKNRFAGGMADINAVNSSAFIIGKALLELQNLNDVASFNAEASMEAIRGKFAFISQAASEMLALHKYKITGYATIAQIFDAAQKAIVASEDDYEKQLQNYTERSILWDLDAHQHAANMVASWSGGTAGRSWQKPQNPSSLSRMLGWVSSGSGAMTIGSGGTFSS